MPEGDANKRRVVLSIIVAAHIIANLVFFLLLHNVGGNIGGDYEIKIAIYIGLVYSESILLGIWIGLGCMFWAWRILIVITMIIYYEAFAFRVLGFHPIFPSLILLVAPCMGVSLVLLLLRRTYAQLHFESKEPIVVCRDLLQFSIRDLMRLTFIIAVLLSITIAVRPYLPAFNPGLPLILLMNVAIGIPVGLVATWATLRKGSVIIPCTIVASCAITFGILLHSVNSFFGDTFASVAIYSTTAFLISTLLAVRSCGYRLVRIQRMDAAARESFGQD